MNTDDITILLDHVKQLHAKCDMKIMISAIQRVIQKDQVMGTKTIHDIINDILPKSEPKGIVELLNKWGFHG